MRELFIKAGKRIAFIREFRKLTREELANESGVPTETISIIEEQGKGFTGTIIYNICKVLKVDPNFIMDGRTSRIYESELGDAIKAYNLQN